MERVYHPFEPIYNRDSRILILGSMPSVKSRETYFYYGHPQNRFWKVLASITNSPIPLSIPEKTSLLLDNHIAVWDVIHSCYIEQSSDSSIKSVQPNDIRSLLNNSSIAMIYANGTTAKKLYDKHIYPQTIKDCIMLPSTSPANATFSLERLIAEWAQINQFLL